MPRSTRTKVIPVTTEETSVPDTATPTMPTLPVLQTPLAIATMDLDALKEVNEEAGDVGMSPFNLAKITVPGAGALTFAFTQLDGKKVPKETIEAIIVHHHAYRQYYDGPYDPTAEPAPPLCMSWDGKVGTGSPGGSCEHCPLSKFDEDTGEPPPCSEYRMLYLLLPNEVMPRLMQVPRTSLPIVRKYLADAPRNPVSIRPLRSFTTVIGLQERKKGIGMVLNFKRGADLTKEGVALVKMYAEGFRASLDYPPLKGRGGAVYSDPTAAPASSTATTGQGAQTTTVNPLIVDPDSDDIPQ